MVDEKALLERARTGDREAFDQLVRAHFPRVYAVAFRLVGNHEDAEDLAQDAFVKAHRALSWYRGEGAFATWIYRIVVHLARDRFRRVERRPVEAALVAPVESRAGGGPAEELDRRELQRVLLDSLRRLPERLRTPLVLRTMEGLDYRDVAEATGVTPDTARTQVMKARRALARVMRPFLGGLGGSERTGGEQ
ncbi:MAG: sigma-70 family RNA polymerase sigma factor [Planctomycetota bacterium]